MTIVASGEDPASLSVPGVVVQEDPAVYLAVLPGKWLLDHSTPSWRIEDPHKGFQRIVKKERARAIARTVLEGGRAFPNSLTLATTTREYETIDNRIVFPGAARLLVVDGQHRLWAQHHSEFDGRYPCVIHMNRTERDMAALFLEINDNQRRVPSSLRWDLVRLVRPGDPAAVLTAEVVFELATRKESPFYAVGIDMTGEKPLTIKQGSLAPEIRSIVGKHKRREGDANLEAWTALFVRFFVAIKSVDGRWGTTESPFFRARVLRALLRVLADLLSSSSMDALTTPRLREYVQRIEVSTLAPEVVRRVQGAAGVKDLYLQMKQQMLP